MTPSFGQHQTSALFKNLNFFLGVLVHVKIGVKKVFHYESRNCDLDQFTIMNGYQSNLSLFYIMLPQMAAFTKHCFCEDLLVMKPNRKGKFTYFPLNNHVINLHAELMLYERRHCVVLIKSNEIM